MLKFLVTKQQMTWQVNINLYQTPQIPSVMTAKSIIKNNIKNKHNS